MSDNSVQLTLTDIPYNEVNRASNGLRNLDKQNADILTFDLTEFLNDIYRITESTIIIFCGKEQVSQIHEYFSNKQAKKLGTVRQLIWEKTNPSPMNGQYIYLSGIENMIWFKKKGGTFNAKCKNTVFRFPCGRSKLHPTEKNINLLKELINENSNENDIVLDPFCGSGTTLVAADILNRKYIGIDISEEAVQLTKLRLKNPVKTESNLLNSGVKAYDKKNDIEKQILSNFSCHTVQRNKGIDAFLSRKHNNMLIPIRIQKEQETLSEAVEMLNRAAVKKGCNLKILIKTNSKDDNVNIPPDIIIMDSYQLTIDGILFK